MYKLLKVFPKYLQFLFKNKIEKKKKRPSGPTFSIVLHNKSYVIVSLCGCVIQLSVN